MRKSGNPCQQKAQVLHSLTMGSRLRGNDDAARERRFQLPVLEKKASGFRRWLECWM